MSLLNKLSTPAERMRGITFSENFQNPASVIQNGGTISGAEVCNGATFDGSGEWIRYNFQGTEFNSDIISISIDIIPNFSDASGVNRLICGANGNATYLRFKDGNILQFFIDGTKVISCDYATFNQGEKNNITFCIDSSGDNVCYINGVEFINTTASSTWTPVAITSFDIGDYANSGGFDGEITSFKIFHKCLTQQEALDLYNGTTYSYMNDAVVNLPMGACQHDPSNTSGVELLTDGDMEAPDTSAWLEGNNPDATKVSDGVNGGQALRVAYDGSNNPFVYQSVLTVGKKYKVSGWVRGDGSIVPRIKIGNANICDGTNSTDWQYIECVGVADTVNFVLQTLTTGSGYCEFDNFSVQALEERTLDISGNENHGILGDGATTATFPTKLQKKGYVFAGGDYIATTVKAESEGALFVHIKETSNVDFAIGAWGTQNVDNCYIGIRGSNFLGGGIGADPWTIIEGSDNIVNQVITGILTWDGTTVRLYQNGKIVYEAAQNGSPVSGVDLYIGALNSNGSVNNPFFGDIYAAGVLNKAITPIQAADLHINLMSNINQV